MRGRWLCALLLSMAPALAAEQSHDEPSPYLAQVQRYNAGLALLHEGRDAQGRSTLDRVGRLDRREPLMAALADQANYSLAIHLMRRGFGDAAIPVLERIGNPGRLSGPALLALGWAWLQPPTDAPLWSAEVGDERSIGPPPESVGSQQGLIGDRNLYQRHRLLPLARLRMPADWQTRGERALAVWSRLLDRDPDDPSMPLAMLAMAEVLARGGAESEAVQIRERALEVLALQAARVDEARRIASTAPWIDSLLTPLAQALLDGEWQLRRLPTSVLGPYLGQSLAEPRFQMALKALHDGRSPVRQGSDPESASDAALAGPYLLLQALAEEVLRKRGADIDRLRAELRLRLAHQYDRAAFADPAAESVVP